MQPDMKQTWSSSTIRTPVWLGHGQMAPLGNQIGKALCPKRKVGARQKPGPSSCVGGCGGAVTKKDLRPCWPGGSQFTGLGCGVSASEEGRLPWVGGG